jgi:hypothetical protein
MYKAKYYSKNVGVNEYKHRYSKCTKEISCCLTGMCYDLDLFKPFIEFIDKPTEGTTLKDLISEGIEALCTTLRAEYEYRQSDEAIIETIEANEYYFLSNGKLI